MQFWKLSRWCRVFHKFIYGFDNVLRTSRILCLIWLLNIIQMMFDFKYSVVQVLWRKFWSIVNFFFLLVCFIIHKVHLAIFHSLFWFLVWSFPFRISFAVFFSVLNFLYFFENVNVFRKSSSISFKTKSSVFPPVTCWRVAVFCIFHKKEKSLKLQRTQAYLKESY